jgi:peptide-methionine (S)-S-oxide reductase
MAHNVGVSFFMRNQANPSEPLPGRSERPFSVPERHVVLGSLLVDPQAEEEGLASVGLGMGCFWGAERLLWQVPGVRSTAVGYQGGSTANPTYEEVCTGRTGQAEVVQVTYDPSEIELADILKIFWENHDPTQQDRQGNDVGSQYRSAVYCPASSVDLVQASAQTYGAALEREGLGPITTEIAAGESRPFYFAEESHQQYLHKNPHGYDCHSSTGVKFPG